MSKIQYLAVKILPNIGFLTVQDPKGVRHALAAQKALGGRNGTTIQEGLKKLGDLGWQLVPFTPSNNIVIFRRQNRGKSTHKKKRSRA